jgi:intracellular septation protein
MQALLELAPLVAFLIAYLVGGLYTATAVLMAAMALLLGVDLMRGRRISPMHALSAVLVFLFGSATLLLHNQRFIQWKPTVFCWLASAAFLGSLWIGRRTLAQRFLTAALAGEDTQQVPDGVWRRLNALWVAFYAVLGALNLLLAFHASERAWVYFKVAGLPTVTFVFAGVQVAWLLRRFPASAPEPSPQR